MPQLDITSLPTQVFRSAACLGTLNWFLFSKIIPLTILNKRVKLLFGSKLNNYTEAAILENVQQNLKYTESGISFTNTIENIHENLNSVIFKMTDAVEQVKTNNKNEINTETLISFLKSSNPLIMLVGPVEDSISAVTLSLVIFLINIKLGDFISKQTLNTEISKESNLLEEKLDFSTKQTVYKNNLRNNYSKLFYKFCLRLINFLRVTEFKLANNLTSTLFFVVDTKTNVVGNLDDVFFNIDNNDFSEKESN